MAKAKMTVVETVYHQAAGEQPTAFEQRWSSDLSTDEQPHGPRARVKVGEAWQAIDSGWIDPAEVGCLTVSNDGADRDRQGIPDDAEREDLARRVVEVGFVADFDPAYTVAGLSLPPGRSLRVQPIDLSRVRVRCRHRETRITVCLVPA